MKKLFYICAAFLVASQLHSQEKFRIQDAETNTTYLTELMTNPDGSYAFKLDPNAVVPTPTDPEPIVVISGPSTWYQGGFWNAECQCPVYFAVKVCSNTNIWPCLIQWRSNQ